MVHRGVVAALAGSLLAGGAGAQDVDPARYAPLDPPLRTQQVSIPQPRDPNGPGRLTCFFYPDTTVKLLDLNEIGARAISVTPVTAGRPLPPCGKQDDPGEVLLKEGQGSGFGGMVGGFVHTAYVDGHDGTTFRIYDARSGRLLYTDRTASVSGQMERASVAGDVLTLGYTRAVAGPCSILGGGRACWSQFVREARLPPSVAASMPGDCAANYAKGAGGLPGPIGAEDPSYIRYAVTMTLDRSGRAAVLSRGAASCWPQS